MQQLDSDHYDVVVLGTGLAESIAAAAIAKTGRTVLHLDPNNYYGSEQASLTLDELAQWATERSQQNLGTEQSVPSSSSTSDATVADITPASAGPSDYATSQRQRYTRALTSPLSPSLEADRRRYAITLFPALMPSRGPLVGTLIASDVSKYVTFKLLDGVHVWDESGAGRRVPGSKEDVFKDKSVSLPEKRKLMKALMFAGGEFEEDEVMKGHEDEPLLPFLKRAFGLSQQLAEAVTFAVAHAAADEPALPALQRARRYLRSIGRYGPSAFLLGQYGGAGEVAQGFCRACAVFGGTYILGPEATPSNIAVGEQVSLSIPGHPTAITAGHLVCSPDFLPSKETTTTTTAHLIAVVTAQPAVLKRPQSDEPTEDDDTAAIVFPTDAGPIRALIMGEGTGSCPTGQWVVYLWAEAGADTDPAEILKPYLEKLAPEGVVFESTYLQHRAEVTEVAEPQMGPLVQLLPYAGPHILTEGLDWEAEQAQKAFWAVVGEGEEGKGFFERPEGEEEDDDDE